MEPGKAMYYNWNRVVLLDHRPTTEGIRIEKEMRIALQNSFASDPGADMTKKSWAVAKLVEKTLTPDVIKSVDLYMK